MRKDSNMEGIDGNKVLDNLMVILKEKWDYFSEGNIGKNEDEVLNTNIFNIDFYGQMYTFITIDG